MKNLKESIPTVSLSFARGDRRNPGATTATEMATLPFGGLTIAQALAAAEKFGEQISFKKKGGLMPFEFPIELDMNKRTAIISAELFHNEELGMTADQVVYSAETDYGNKMQAFFYFEEVIAGEISYNGKKDSEGRANQLFKINLAKADLSKLKVGGFYQIQVQEREINGNVVMFGSILKENV